MISILRHLHVLAKLLQISGLNRLHQIDNLIAGIIDIILPRHLISGKIEHIAQGVPNCCSARVPQVQASGRIGADELDLHLLALSERNAAILFTLCKDLLQYRIQIALA
ncbi:hypothetical protein D3C77_440080 [compost metagenome]